MNKILIPLMLILSVVLIVVLQFGFIFLLLALLPSIVAYYSDDDPRKTSFKIVFAGNLSAALPTLLPMLKVGVKFKHLDVVSVLRDPKVWLFVYLGAAAGWCIIYICRFISGAVVAMSFDHKIHSLHKEQKLLVQEWGQEITTLPGKKPT